MSRLSAPPHALARDAAILAAERVAEEHAWVCERVKQNLDGGVFHKGILSPSHEGPAAWFPERVARALGAQT